MSNNNHNNNSNNFSPVNNNTNTFSPVNNVTINNPESGGKGNQGLNTVAIVALVLAFLAVMAVVVLGGSEKNDQPQANQPMASHVHTWKAATCTTPKTCIECGATEGTVAHQWIEATQTAPKTCAICGLTSGEKLKPSSVYINELPVYAKYGKVWTMSNKKPSNYVHTDVTSDAAYKDLDTPGHTTGTVYDIKNNTYTYGIHVDGPELSEYYISFNIGGKYTKFTGTCAMTPDVAGETVTKYFEVYGDGRYLGSSPTMGINYQPKSFSFDVTGVQILEIRYPKSTGPSRIAAIFDGKLS